MAHTQRSRRIDSLQRRLNHLNSRLRGEPDGALMYDRKERGALRYALGVIAAARRQGIIDALEADAFQHGEVPIRDLSEQARALLPPLDSAEPGSRTA